MFRWRKVLVIGKLESPPWKRMHIAVHTYMILYAVDFAHMIHIFNIVSFSEYPDNRGTWIQERGNIIWEYDVGEPITASAYVDENLQLMSDRWVRFTVAILSRFYSLKLLVIPNPYWCWFFFKTNHFKSFFFQVGVRLYLLWKRCCSAHQCIYGGGRHGGEEKAYGSRIWSVEAGRRHILLTYYDRWVDFRWL